MFNYRDFCDVTLMAEWQLHVCMQCKVFLLAEVYKQNRVADIEEKMEFQVEMTVCDSFLDHHVQNQPSFVSARIKLHGWNKEADSSQFIDLFTFNFVPFPLYRSCILTYIFIYQVRCQNTIIGMYLQPCSSLEIKTDNCI